MLFPGNAQISGEQQQEQNQAALDDSHASLYHRDRLNDGPLVGGCASGSDHEGDQHHYQRGPFEENGSQVFKRVVGLKDIEKDFVDHFETNCQADGGASPVCVEICGIIRPLVQREDDSEDQHLRNDVGEEHGKDFVLLSPEHDRSHRQLQHRMCYPERQLEV